LTVRNAGNWHRIAIGNLKNIAEATQCVRDLQKQGVKEWCIYTEAKHQQVKCSK
jgi:cell division protein FtsN